MRNSLSDELETFVDRSVRSGKYRSRDEVIRAALRLLQDRERRLEALREDVLEGLDELDRGDGPPLEDRETIGRFFEQVKTEARSRHHRRRAHR